MGSFVVTWRDFLIAVIVVLAVYVARLVVLLRDPDVRRPFWRRSPRQRPESFAIAPLREEIVELKRQIAELRVEVEALRAVAPKENPTPYASAIQLAKGGEAPLAIAAQCGISRGEAELISALYRRR
ncbi:MAG: DUF2802 domain-containing protein [Betaproteobacteria bacterium]|nr:DUF2802 domain-containing protein [Betaproteobacteria bacterium]